MSKVLVITGGPGVGKTTIVNSILRILAAKGVEAASLRPDRPRRQAHDRGDRLRGQDHPPAARGRPQERRLQTRRRQSARLRPAGRRRDLDGRCHADAGADEGGAGRCRAADRRRHRPAALGRTGTGAGRHHRLRRGAGRAADRGLSASRRRAGSSPAPIGSTRAQFPISPGQRATATSTSCRRTIPKPPCRGSSNW